jgi:superfamily II DNA/RNA helicase
MNGKNSKKRKSSTVPFVTASESTQEQTGTSKESTRKVHLDEAATSSASSELKMIQQSSIMSFESLSEPRLSKGVLEYIKKQGFTRMTPVQAATIPQFLSHKDV